MTPLAPLALNLAPELAGALFGPSAESVGPAVAAAVQGATGTSDPAAAQQALARSPEVASNLRLELARIAVTAAQTAREAEAEAFAGRVAAAGAAGAPGGARSSARGRLSWAAPTVSCVVLLTFGGAMLAALTRKLPAGSETVITMLLGTLAAMATSVVSYWVGSSAGSAVKTDLMFGAQQPWAASAPHTSVPKP